MKRSPLWSPSPFRRAIIEADHSGDKAPVIAALLDPMIPKTESDHRDLADYLARNMKPGRKPWPPLYLHESRLKARAYFDRLPKDKPEDVRIAETAAAFALPESNVRSIVDSSLESLKTYRGPIAPDLSMADES